MLRSARQLSKLTYRARALQVIESTRDNCASKEQIARIASLGWLAGGGDGSPAGRVFLMTQTQNDAPKLLESLYRRAYILSEQDSKPVRITKRGLEIYTKSIRGIAYGLWSNSISQAEFVTAFTSATNRGLGRAWREGAAEFGIAPDELTAAERSEIESEIGAQGQFINRLSTDIKRGDRITGGKWGQFKDRINSAWSNTYNNLKNRGMLLAGKNQKMEWVLHLAHFTEDPCEDCLIMNGRVYRQGTWRNARVFPQSRDLKCNGYNCGCDFRAAPDKPLNKGRPPKLFHQRGGR